MRAWDRHCPECHSDARITRRVAPRQVVVHCADCGHKWNEEREPELFRGNYVNTDVLEP